MSDPLPGTDGDVAFDEAAYLTAFPKIAESIRSGALRSALDHYTKRGAAERRLDHPRYRKALADQALLARLAAPRAGGRETAAAPAADWAGVPSGLDALMVSPEGTCLAIGWVDDRGQALASVRVCLPDGRVVPSMDFARCRRPGAEATIGCAPGKLLGFYALIDLAQAAPPPPGTQVALQCGQDTATHAAQPHLVAATELRDSAFEYLAAASYFGNPLVESFLQLDGGIGERLLAINALLSARIAGLAHVERYGPQAGPFAASVVVCLYGRVEYLFLQAAIFSAGPGARAYEYIYVCNSPELTETLQREARMAAQVYGLSLTLVFLPGNAGFGAANNAAVRYARSARLLMLNPDVLPRGPGWAADHLALVDALPAAQTDLFGVPLFYDDGSMMHGGMYVDSDIGLSVRTDGVVRQELLRVEHYGKGAPPGYAPYRGSRMVTAVTGAAIGADRAWFERLGGFSEAYVFGHYEDADLGLKAWRAGGQVWLHDLPFWHLEGKGSTRLAAHEGGSLINRWHFTRTWLATIEDGMRGQHPARLAA